MELSTGRPSFDVVSISLHVQKRLIEKGKWMEDLRLYLRDAGKTNPDFDFADFSVAHYAMARPRTARCTLCRICSDFWNGSTETRRCSPKGPRLSQDHGRNVGDRPQAQRSRQGRLWLRRPRPEERQRPSVHPDLLAMGKETLSADGKILSMDTPDAIWAAGTVQETDARGCAIRRDWIQLERMPDHSLLRVAPRCGWTASAFPALLVDPTKSKIVKDIGFAVMPPGPKAQHSAMFCSGLCIPAASKNKLGAWLYIQWATDKANCADILRLGAGMPPRASAFRDETVRKSSAFPAEWFETAIACQNIVRPGLPEIVAVTEFRDVFGVALTNIISGGDPADELKKATSAFRPVFEKEQA